MQPSVTNLYYFAGRVSNFPWNIIPPPPPLPLPPPPRVIRSIGKTRLSRGIRRNRKDYGREV